MINLNDLKRQCVEIQNKRIENGAKFAGGGILKHLATKVVEAAVAQDRYLDRRTFETHDDYAEELADIVICVLIAAAGIDIEKAILGKIEKNRQRAEMQGDKL